MCLRYRERFSNAPSHLCIALERASSTLKDTGKLEKLSARYKLFDDANFSVSADNKTTGNRNGNVEQAQAKVHGNDTVVHVQLLSDNAKHDECVDLKK